MKLYNIYILFILFFSFNVFTSCNVDDPVIPNEEELITTLNFTLISSIGGDPVELSILDLDGEGDDIPVVTTSPLAANTTYTGILELLNEIEFPVINITEEIQEEKEDHQFFFTSSSGLNLTVTYNDVDANGKPVGISTILETGNASTGTLTITLRHEPNKLAPGVSEGNLENAGGETDIEVPFDITIQ